MDPMTIMSLIMLASQAGPKFGGALGFLGGGQDKKPPDTAQSIQKLFDLYMKMLGPAASAQGNLGALQGQAVGQQLASSMGSLGVGSTGMGAVARGIGNTMANAGAMRGQADIRRLAAQLAGQGAGLDLQAFGMTPPSRMQNLQSGLGMMMLSGQNPFEQFMNQYGKTSMQAPSVQAPRVPR